MDISQKEIDEMLERLKKPELQIAMLRQMFIGVNGIRASHEKLLMEIQERWATLLPQDEKTWFSERCSVLAQELKNDNAAIVRMFARVLEKDVEDYRRSLGLPDDPPSAE